MAFHGIRKSHIPSKSTDSAGQLGISLVLLKRISCADGMSGPIGLEWTLRGIQCSDTFPMKVLKVLMFLSMNPFN